MKLTKEQTDIINSTGNIKINAVAGSGKTTTIIEYARTRPADSRILYLAFNKSVKLEAVRKFEEKGLHNVKVETAHSLAYRYIVYQNNYRIKANGYKTNEIAELLNLKGNDEKHTEYIIANHINKFITYFCNSNKNKVQELNYLDTIADDKAKAFVTTFYAYILGQSRLLLSKMNSGEIEITHDFYLKKFQLASPQLPYDYILFDEGQDASPAMLDLFLKQDAVKVIVGDTHQQIYGWRFAVNSLEKANFKSYYLTNSFRFGQDIANLAMDVLKFKTNLEQYKAIPITGNGVSKVHKTQAVLARTNLGLLLKAIEYVTEKKVKHIYFEGNINSYTYADEGASLYDVLNLYNDKHAMIRDNLIKSMKNMDELEDYIEKTEDVQLGMMVEIVKEYENEIPDLIKSIKAKHVENNDKEKAEIIFSTVHRCKGMEYDTVYLVNDFITKEKIERQSIDKYAATYDAAKLNEEINLLYVAVTRAKNTLHIPDKMMPKDFSVSPHIVIVKTIEDNVTKTSKTKVGNPPSYKSKSVGKSRNIADKEKTYSVEIVRTSVKEAYRPWTSELDEELTIKYYQGATPKELAKHFNRTVGAIIARVKKLELLEFD